MDWKGRRTPTLLIVLQPRQILVGLLIGIWHHKFWLNTLTYLTSNPFVWSSIWMHIWQYVSCVCLANTVMIRYGPGLKPNRMWLGIDMHWSSRSRKPVRNFGRKDPAFNIHAKDQTLRIWDASFFVKWSSRKARLHWIYIYISLLQQWGSYKILHTRDKTRHS